MGEGDSIDDMSAEKECHRLSQMGGLLDYLLKLAPQIRDIISIGSLLATLNHGLLVDLRGLLAHDSHLVVSTTVVVPDFMCCYQISHRKVQRFLLCPGRCRSRLFWWTDGGEALAAE